MRITSGQYKNRNLFVPEGKFVRPTSDRMRQSIFNVLRHPKWDGDFSLEGKNIADLFCGSGSLGLEALSNGAKHCIFIDQDTRAIENNSGFLSEDDLKVIKSSMPNFRCSEIKNPFDLVFMDPPYEQNLVKPTVNYLLEKRLLSEQAILIIETEKNCKLDLDLELLDNRVQSKSELRFYRYK